MLYVLGLWVILAALIGAGKIVAKAADDRGRSGGAWAAVALLVVGGLFVASLVSAATGGDPIRAESYAFTWVNVMAAFVLPVVAVVGLVTLIRNLPIPRRTFRGELQVHVLAGPDDIRGAAALAVDDGRVILRSVQGSADEPVLASIEAAQVTAAVDGECVRLTADEQTYLLLPAGGNRSVRRAWAEALQRGIQAATL